MYVCVHACMVCVCFTNGSSCGSINKHALKRKKKKPEGALTKMRILKITWKLFYEKKNKYSKRGRGHWNNMVSAFKFLKDLRWVSGTQRSCSVAKLCPTLCDPMDCSMPGPLSSTVSQSLLKFMPTELAMLSSHLILCLNLLLLLSIFPSIRVFSIESAPCISWPKY